MNHIDFMKRALKLAAKGKTSPNPMVGAVIVKDGEIIGEGYHPRAGEPHAEIFALRDAGERAKGAAMYVTLEPCCHFGRTPPCTKAVIEAGIAEVYVAMADPDVKVAGNGIKELLQAGIKVHHPLCEEEAKQLNEAYIKHRTTGMPFVILKSAMSLDGKIAARTGDSKWITNDRSRAYVHKIRDKVDVVLVGSGTARADNPRLTARVGIKVHYPVRVVVSTNGELPADLAVFCEPGESMVVCLGRAENDSIKKLEASGVRIIRVSESGGRPSIADLLKKLGEMGYSSVLIEGGGEVAASALEEKVVDKVIYFYAPKIIGGKDAVNAVGGKGADDVASSIKLDRIKVRRFGDDVAIEGYVTRQ